jgi:hypothetical protein
MSSPGSQGKQIDIANIGATLCQELYLGSVFRILFQVPLEAVCYDYLQRCFHSVLNMHLLPRFHILFPHNKNAHERPRYFPPEGRHTTRAITKIRVNEISQHQLGRLQLEFDGSYTRSSSNDCI